MIAVPATLRKTLFFDVKLDLQAGVRLSSAFLGYRPTLPRFPSPFFFGSATIVRNAQASMTAVGSVHTVRIVSSQSLARR